MSSVGMSATGQSLLGKYRIIIIGIIVFAVGITMYTLAGSFLSLMSLCENGAQANFFPGTVVTASCPVISDIGQELSFRAHFYTTAGAERISLPAHLEIRDPDNVVLYDRDFEDTTVISFKPRSYGEYTATITSLQEEYHPTYKQTTVISYGFGFLTDKPDVHNPVGNAFVLMLPLGEITYFSGIAIIIYGIVKALRKRNNHP